MAEGIRDQRPAAWRALPRTLAGFFPVAVFGLVLLFAIGEWGLFAGVLAGTALGAAAAWALTRLIAAFPILQWTAATVIALALRRPFVLLNDDEGNGAPGPTRTGTPFDKRF